ncbi:hypothetical protein UWK_01064 [Desulfocapsa sulfexigens DSM 10523]|uniref:Uncharacterized protein n=1 Tax=Desulfocapsa sulfexigens (strain DSM 10523 / SB164P1) TaxID=1167006 RepID=M1PMG6_DESSD|nr:hypothetical protein [Desulfocapsa sulfexigens]AGF77636.1 hypothetical protein UWK_01064 [Desulfocapsa sulfexigens DSM 10523]
MPINDLIIALSNSNIEVPSNVIPILWQAQNYIPDQVIDSILTALEDSQEDHPEILNILLAECAPGFSIESIGSQRPVGD